MTTVVLVSLAAIAVLGLGGLIGSSMTTQVMEQTGRKHAAERRRLNQEWRALESARATGREVCSGCRRLPRSGWVALVDDDEDGD